MSSNEHQIKWTNERTEKSDHLVDEFDNATRYIRGLLGLLGIWPMVVSKPNEIVYVLSTRLLLPLVSMLLMSFTVPTCYYVIVYPIDRFEMIVLLGPIAFQVGNILMHLAMVVRSSSIKICVEHMKLDWGSIDNTEEHEIMSRYQRFSRSITVACLCLVYTSAIFYSLIMPFLQGDTINARNETIRPRPHPSTETFFDVQADVVYEIVFTINFFGALFHNTVMLTASVLLIVLVSHACAQIQVIKSSLDNSDHQPTEKNDFANLVANRMNLVIQKHVRLIEFAHAIDSTMREIILVEVAAITLIICFIEYYILITLEADDVDRMAVVTYFMLFSSFSFHLFVYCQFGEVLKEQCEEIGYVAYLINWLKLPKRTQLALIMIINVSNHPCNLTAGGIIELSRVNFASILKTSFAYFNMMRAMT